MKVIAIADTHGHLPDIPECDLLLIAGDVCPDYIDTHIGQGSMKQASWLCGPFNDWLERIPARQIVGIAGNHDFALEETEVGAGLSWTYLCNEWTIANGLFIYGIPQVPNLPNWAFAATAGELKQYYLRVPTQTDIVLSHGPAYGFGDRVARAKYPGEDLNVGAIAALPMLDRVQPKVFISGHIHEAHGHYHHSETSMVNVSYLNERYQPVHKPVDISNLL